MKPTTMLLPVALLTLTACASRQPAATSGTTVTTVPAATPGQQVVTVESGAAASPRGEVRHSVNGRVQGIDRNAGEITVMATDGSKMTLKVAPLAAANMREGDDVSVNVVVRPR
jgi:hypothetical protein